MLADLFLEWLIEQPGRLLGWLLKRLGVDDETAENWGEWAWTALLVAGLIWLALRHS